MQAEFTYTLVRRSTHMLTVCLHLNFSITRTVAFAESWLIQERIEYNMTPVECKNTFSYKCQWFCLMIWQVQNNHYLMFRGKCEKNSFVKLLHLGGKDIFCVLNLRFQGCVCTILYSILFQLLINWCWRRGYFGNYTAWCTLPAIVVVGGRWTCRDWRLK